MVDVHNVLNLKCNFIGSPWHDYRSLHLKLGVYEPFTAEKQISKVQLLVSLEVYTTRRFIGKDTYASVLKYCTLKLFCAITEKSFRDQMQSVFWAESREH